MADKDESPKQLKQKLTNITNDLQAAIKTIDKYTEEQQVAERNRNELEDTKKKLLVLQWRFADTEALCKHRQNENNSLLKTLREKETKINEQNKKLQQNERLIKQKDIRITELKNVVEHRTLNTIDKSAFKDEKTKERLLQESNETQNMPVVAELSDENRPTKLAERFTELFDNQWTDAFEQIVNGFSSEEKCIEVLLQLLQDIMEFCKSRERKQIQGLQKVLSCSSSPTSTGIPAFVYKNIKEFRRSIAEFSGGQIYKKFQKELTWSESPTANVARQIPEYVEECLKICWLMTIQDPPVIFGPMAARGEVLNIDVYKPYTSSGHYVNFIVWPALLLNEDGHVLSKGVAQGYGEKLHKRLSATASAKLTDDNPNIADMSDINRPTKLSEQYSELYDNEWTDAFDALTNTKKGNKPEEDACKLLLDVLTTIYSKCYEKSKEGLQELTKVLSSFNGMEVPSKVLLRVLKDDRKKNHRYMINTLREEVKHSLQGIITENDAFFITNYIEKCITLCWLMAIQDPPVYIDPETHRHDADLDTDRYKHYTQSGTAIDYIVWPVLYLHEGGSILYKGIAQGKKRES